MSRIVEVKIGSLMVCKPVVSRLDIFGPFLGLTEMKALLPDLPRHHYNPRMYLTFQKAFPPY